MGGGHEGGHHSIRTRATKHATEEPISRSLHPVTDTSRGARPQEPGTAALVGGGGGDIDTMEDTACM